MQSKAHEFRPMSGLSTAPAMDGTAAIVYSKGIHWIV